jgi:predicted AlkP superfamily pyrophosphatase or phosphodiesterase
MSVLVISFDAVSDKVFEAMAKDSKNYPNVAKFKNEAYYAGGIQTIFVSNTYPVHTTISTGKLPKDHGIISNLLPPNKIGERPWAQMAKYIKARTIWEAAREKKLTTAAMLWPVTCGAKISYHMPEVHPEKGQNLLFRSLLYGSVFFQLSTFFKYRKKLIEVIKNLKHGGQPELDNLTTSVTCDLLKKKKCDLVLVHLIAYDTLFHFSGSKGKEIEMAKKSLDDNLGRLLECWEENTVIIFSDHSQLDVHETINLDEIYGNAVFEQAGGCAFFHKETKGLALKIEKMPWFERFLTKEEMEESGYADKQVIGIAAKPGYAFSESSKYKGSHGYPSDYNDYNVFYCVKGKNFVQHQEQNEHKKHITDITAIIAGELNLNM